MRKHIGNVVSMTDRLHSTTASLINSNPQRDDLVVSFTIPLRTIAHTAESLTELLIALELSLATLGKADTFGADMALAGAADVMGAAAARSAAAAAERRRRKWGLRD